MALWKPWHLAAAAVVLSVCVSAAIVSPLLKTSKHVEGAPAHFLLHAVFPTHQEMKDLTCLECKSAAAVVTSMMEAGATEEEIKDFAILECINLNLSHEDVCRGMVELCTHEVLFVLNTTKYDLDTICGWMLESHCGSTDLDPWTLEIPGGKPEPVHPEPLQPTPGVMRILHLSDLHIDLLYDEGSAVDCEHPICCHNAFGIPGPGEEAAGPWGALANCDIPLHTFEDLLAQAALTNPDLVYVTGDLPPHDVWARTHDSNLMIMNITMKLLKQYFPNIPVVNVLGNHASAPDNSFVVPEAYDDGFNMDWLYNGVAEMWSPWLPSEVLPDVRRGGFFSYSPLPGLRVVSLNMNYCNTFNWWLLIENKDPVGELQWLVDTLAAAEMAGEVVHLLGHIPPGGSSCDHTWSHMFNLIITRFESTIRGMFYGHQHTDSWQVLYDPESNYTRPVATVFIPGSVTTGKDHNPSFRICVVDGGHDAATWTVLDTETYNMNLTLANAEGGIPEYTLRYTAQDAYGVTSMTPAQVDQLVFDMATDDDLFQEYIRNRKNYLSEPPEMWTCDEECRKEELCQLVSGDSSTQEPCHRIEAVVDGASL